MMTSHDDPMRLWITTLLLICFSLHTLGCSHSPPYTGRNENIASEPPANNLFDSNKVSMSRKIAVNSKLDSIILEAAKREFDYEFPTESIISENIEGLVLSGTPEILKITNEIVKGKPLSVPWKSIASECITALCALSRAFDSEELALRALTLGKKYGFIVSLQYFQDTRKPQRVGASNPLPQWSLDDVRILSYLFAVLPSEFRHMTAPNGTRPIFLYRGEGSYGASAAIVHNSGLVITDNWSVNPESRVGRWIHELAHLYNHHIKHKRRMEITDTSRFLMLHWICTNTDHTDCSMNPDKKLVTTYAETSPSEDFAELLAYYVTDPNSLLLADPEGYSFAKDVVFGGHEYIGGVLVEASRAEALYRRIRDCISRKDLRRACLTSEKIVAQKTDAYTQIPLKIMKNFVTLERDTSGAFYHEFFASLERSRGLTSFDFLKIALLQSKVTIPAGDSLPLLSAEAVAATMRRLGYTLDKTCSFDIQRINSTSEFHSFQRMYHHEVLAPWEAAITSCANELCKKKLFNQYLNDWFKTTSHWITPPAEKNKRAQ